MKRLRVLLLLGCAGWTHAAQYGTQDGTQYEIQYGPIPESLPIGEHPKAAVPFDLPALKLLWAKRIRAIKARGVLPIIDIESSFNPAGVNAAEYAAAMDANGIALTAFSAQVGAKKYANKGTLWSDGARRALRADPSRYIPTSTAGIYPAFTAEPDAFVAATITAVQSENYPLMGEFEFRHYPSPRQYQRRQAYRDVAVPIDSAAGQALFDFAERSGISFQIHYEVEDALLPPLETMLARYPKAKVIWCHLGQVRYAARAGRYSPQYVRRLIEKYPNIYFDLAFGGANSVYPPSHEHHATLWASPDTVKQAWIDVITAHPDRFLAALDIGGDRLDAVSGNTRTLRAFMDNLPASVREIVAYKAAWRLLFGEDL